MTDETATLTRRIPRDAFEQALMEAHLRRVLQDWGTSSTTYTARVRASLAGTMEPDGTWRVLLEPVTEAFDPAHLFDTPSATGTAWLAWNPNGFEDGDALHVVSSWPTQEQIPAYQLLPDVPPITRWTIGV